MKNAGVKDTEIQLHPQLAAAELANLSLSQNVAVRAAVARHPNTAPFILGTLAAEFPAQVLRNPALPLLRLADPRLTQRWPESALLALVRQPQAPNWLRKQALAHPKAELQVVLASHPDLTHGEVQALARHYSWLVRARVAARADLVPEMMQQLAGDLHYAVRLAVVSRTDLPLEHRVKFLTDPSRFVRQEAMRRTAPAR